jgi:hypothetical protein
MDPTVLDFAPLSHGVVQGSILLHGGQWLDDKLDISERKVWVPCYFFVFHEPNGTQRNDFLAFFAPSEPVWTWYITWLCRRMSLSTVNIIWMIPRTIVGVSCGFHDILVFHLDLGPVEPTI